MITHSNKAPANVPLDLPTAETLRELRWAHGRSMEQCARQLQIPLVDFLAKERGRTAFTADELQALLDFLDIDAAQLRRRIPGPRS